MWMMHLHAKINYDNDLYDLILYVPVINFSVMSGRVEPVLSKDNVSCSRTHNSDSREAQTLKPPGARLAGFMNETCRW